MCLCAPLSKIYWFINNKLDCYQMPATSTEFILPIQYSYVWVDTLLKRFQVVNVISDRITLYTSKSWRTLPTEQCNQLSCCYLKTSRGTLCTGPNLGTLGFPSPQQIQLLSQEKANMTYLSHRVVFVLSMKIPWHYTQEAISLHSEWWENNSYEESCIHFLRL